MVELGFRLSHSVNKRWWTLVYILRYEVLLPTFLIGWLKKCGFSKL